MNKWVAGLLRNTYQSNIYAEYCHLLPQSACEYMYLHTSTFLAYFK